MDAGYKHSLWLNLKGIVETFLLFPISNNKILIEAEV